MRSLPEGAVTAPRAQKDAERPKKRRANRSNRKSEKVVRIEELYTDKGKRVRHGITVLENDSQEKGVESSTDSESYLADESSTESSPGISDFSDEEGPSRVRGNDVARGRGSVWVRALSAYKI